MKGKRIDTKVDLGGLALRNPVMTASGTFGYGLEFRDYLDLSSLGAIIVKGLSLKPVKGNRPQRLVETAAGLLNAIGLQNIGVEAFIYDKMPLLEKYKTPVIANIYGIDVAEYVSVAERLDDSAVAGVEINISCPNVKKGGLQFAADKPAIAGIIRGVKGVFGRHVMVKLSPNTGNIEEIAAACEGEGADSVSLINTLIGMSIDIKKRKPVLSNIYGGLSGPAIKPVALAMVHKVSKKVKIPVIGIGGIMSAQDAIEFIMAGATAVQVGTASFRNPAAAQAVAEGIKKYMEENSLQNISDMTGCI